MGRFVRRRAPWSVLGFACALALVLGGGAALASAVNSVKITSLSPNSGPNGTTYKVIVKGYATQTYDELSLDLVNVPSHPCPSSYTAGFSQLGGLWGPKYVKKGNFSETISVTNKTSQPGKYSVCAYLLRASATKAHASSSFTVTQ